MTERLRNVNQTFAKRSKWKRIIEIIIGISSVVIGILLLGIIIGSALYIKAYGGNWWQEWVAYGVGGYDQLIGWMAVVILLVYTGVILLRH